jgi:hypothetical protein
VRHARLILTALCSMVSQIASADVRNMIVEEATCKDLGFRPKTVAFGECVIELLGRSQGQTGSGTGSVRSKVAQSTPPSQALSPDEQTCTTYGFKPLTQPFAQCVMQLDQAKQEAQIAQQQYEIQVAQYQQQVASYQAQQEAIKRERDRRKWEMLARLGAGMANSRSPSLLGAFNEGLAAANGVQIDRPVAPPPPPSQNYTLRLPNGNQVYCSYSAGYMSCR